MTSGEGTIGDPPPPQDADDGWDRGWEAPRRRQALLGLKMTPAERLRWLEETMEELRRFAGRAKDAPPVDPEKP